jgi:hypothetical protein
MAQTRVAVSRDDGQDRDGRWDDQVAASATSATGGVPGRRTVTIRGRGSERYHAPTPRRPSERRHEREGFRPDRAAMWAVLLGVMLILVAVTSAHAATF